MPSWEIGNAIRLAGRRAGVIPGGVVRSARVYMKLRDDDVYCRHLRYYPKHRRVIIFYFETIVSSPVAVLDSHYRRT